jgi:mannose-6-phosphate isomerase
MQPLRFLPLLKRLRWGGRRLGTVLGKPIGPEADYAESWEVCDHGADQSVVAEGAEQGKSLSQLVRRQGTELLGRHAGLDQFPLLLKFLDASDRLSVQVHPNDEQAVTYAPHERGKTEAWVILAAEPGSVVYAGLEPGVTRERLAQAMEQGTVAECLHRLPVRPGDCLFIPAGTVHAIGEGILLAEVQQSSDLTFRLFDWNRVGTDGKPRALHPEQSLACIDFDCGPVLPAVPQVVLDEPGHRAERLVECAYFQIVRRRFSRGIELPAEDRCRLLMTLQGAGMCRGASQSTPLGMGETLLVPAVTERAELVPEGAMELLEITWE